MSIEKYFKMMEDHFNEKRRYGADSKYGEIAWVSENRENKSRVCSINSREKERVTRNGPLEINMV